MPPWVRALKYQSKLFVYIIKTTSVKLAVFINFSVGTGLDLSLHFFADLDNCMGLPLANHCITRDPNFNIWTYFFAL